MHARTVAGGPSLIRRMLRREWLRGSLRCAAAAAFAPMLESCAERRRHRSGQDSAVTVLYEGDPADAFGPYYDASAKFLVFMPLVAWNRRGELEGRLAESWQYSPDLRTCTVRLRDGIRWHDGVPVTAHDVKFTLDLMALPDTLAYSPGSYSVQVLDKRTYTVTYHFQSFADAGPLDDDLACWPKHLLEGLDPKQILKWDFWSGPVGCGPYRHVRTVPQTMMEFEANPDYYRGRPKIKKVILKFAGWKPASSMPELLSGNVDAAVSWAKRDITSAQRNPRFRVYQKPGIGCQAIWLNVRHACFQDARVRRALVHSIAAR